MQDLVHTKQYSSTRAKSKAIKNNKNTQQKPINTFLAATTYILQVKVKTSKVTNRQRVS